MCVQYNLPAFNPGRLCVRDCFWINSRILGSRLEVEEDTRAVSKSDSQHRRKRAEEVWCDERATAAAMI